MHCRLSLETKSMYVGYFALFSSLFEPHNNERRITPQNQAAHRVYLDHVQVHCSVKGLSG